MERVVFSVALQEPRLEALASHPEAFAADHDMTEVPGAEAWAQRIRQNEAGKEGIICVAKRRVRC